MKIISRQPGDNLHEILANWFTAPELGLLLAEEIVSSGMSDTRLWRVSVGEQVFCLRRNPILLFLLDQAYDHRQVHGFLRYLQRQGCHDIACPIATLKQDTLLKTSDAIWELTNFLPGNSCKAPSDEQALAAVEYLAKLHLVAANYHRLEPRYSRALKDRRKICQELADGKLQRLSAAIEASPTTVELEIARKIVLQVRSILALVRVHLERGCVKLPLQWCLIDCHIGNFLFTEGRVTGLVDFVTAYPGSVSRDIARLVGSVTANNTDRWRTCINVYQKHRPLSADELNATLAFHSSGLIGTAARWLEWVFVSRQEVADAATTHMKFVQLSAQIAAINETTAIFATISAQKP